MSRTTSTPSMRGDAHRGRGRSGGAPASRARRGVDPARAQLRLVALRRSVSGVVPAAAEPGGTRGVMLELPDVTLGCVDTREPVMALWAMRRTMGGIRFGDAVLFTDSSRLSAAPERHPRRRRARRNDRGLFAVHAARPGAAHRHVAPAGRAMGWLRHAAAALAARLPCMGLHRRALARHSRPTESVGNGGFSLRSRRLAERAARPGDPDQPPGRHLHLPAQPAAAGAAARRSHRAAGGGRSLRVRTTDCRCRRRSASMACSTFRAS